jgi:hypothetical protein
LVLIDIHVSSFLWISLAFTNTCFHTLILTVMTDFPSMFLTYLYLL